ncbi:hypothetical protein PVAG01_05064 [Phlyctema vagabunda]|uniref:ASST-domain-containing protein n=1 Tax=Phlyctema vagabunda TaxID=108571 RepID=A0ABR4PJ05_9HELO
MYSISLLASSLVCLLGALPAHAADTGTWPWQTYKSSPMEPPSLKVTKSGPTSPGYLFFDQNGSGAHNYSLFIMTDDNELIWQSPYGDLSAYRAQMFDGKPVLTYFNGVAFSEPFGFGLGIIQVLDDSYESIYNVTIENAGFVTMPEVSVAEIVSWIDIHEALVTPQGTMLVTAVNVTQTDLTSVGGPEDGWIADSLFYEIDIKSNEVLFQWNSLDHADQVPLSNALTFYPLEDLGRNQSYPWGPFHINSVEKFQDGSYLVSSRYYSSLFKIALDGTVDWTLEGKTGGDFELGPGLSFSYQHDARIHHEGNNTVLISIHNNANSAIVSGKEQTTGLFMELNTQTWKAMLTRKLFDPADPVYAVSQGGLQLLDDQHTIMGYGSTPKIKEYSPNGSCVMTAQFGPSSTVQSYRAFRLPWVGRPKTAPDAFACVDQVSNKTLVYMSWNGATEHRSWNVYAGKSQESLHLAGHAKKTGFETVTAIGGSPSYIRVEAEGLNITSGVSSMISPQDSC